MSEVKNEGQIPVQTEEKKKGCGIFAKIGCFLVFILFLGGGGWGYFSYYFPVAEGVKTGNLNYITKKGYLFKTWEGRLIQEGLKSGKVTGSIQNNEFIFSVADERVAKMMETIAENNLQLHYTEYNNPLPWRGFSEFVVDSIVSVNNIPVNIYLERKKNGELMTSSAQTNEATTAVSTQNQPATLQDALEQLRSAQEQIKQMQQEIQRLQQNSNYNNGQNNYNNNGDYNNNSNSGYNNSNSYNNGNSGNNRRYQNPADNNRRTDDGQVFQQND